MFAKALDDDAKQNGNPKRKTETKRTNLGEYGIPRPKPNYSERGLKPAKSDDFETMKTKLDKMINNVSKNDICSKQGIADDAIYSVTWTMPAPDLNKCAVPGLIKPVDIKLCIITDHLM